MDDSRFHEPVLCSEAVELLRPRGGGMYLDGTLGGGGHAEAILEAAGPEGRLIGLDRDPAAIDHARRRLARFGERVVLHVANFAEIDRTPGLERARFDGALLDLGVSSAQIDDKARGFSYQQDAPLDMRMGPRGEPARDLLSRADFDSLVRILRMYGEERHARRIARAILREREREPIDTSGRLRAVIEAEVPAKAHRLKTVARVFQALRIAVNDELAAIEPGLRKITERLEDGARLVVIAYHSLEDRIVKHVFREFASECVCPPDFPVCRCDKVAEAEILTSRPIRPDEVEIAANPRARSARLRAIERRRAMESL
ncbi:MAG TPA: 16S rRNA (cytosine(1402)-N(4))-methyltransferase RsmH [Gemmatimonadota bacterium]|nr:16S rRNA (cytosine(1402)-N(4))-methyltransferase RsmH [Gemmatimonadota bacterium]